MLNRSNRHDGYWAPVILFNLKELQIEVVRSTVVRVRPFLRWVAGSKEQLSHC
jgi:hypothetical protein